jgi:hypothetical protein
MKNRPFRYLALCLSVGGVSTLQPVQGYNYDTHDRLTVQAVSHSQLSQYLPMIGLKSITKDELTFHDDKAFCTEEFVCTTITMTIRDWLRRGAEHEDATVLISKNKDEVNDEDLNIARYQHHFYDPISGNGYSYGPLTGHSAPDWGLEDTQDFPDNQNFSLKDARDYLFRGLTKPDKQDRETNLALMFQALGHALHLIEDMAQPQHTRNDSHGGYIFGETSLYEAYTELDNAENPILSNLPFSGYAPVTLPNARDYWYTADQNQGMADYSNRGFVSAGTNFGSNRYVEPQQLRDNGSVIITQKSLEELFQEVNLPVPTQLTNDKHAVMEFVQNTVTDHYRPELTTVNERAATTSLFAADLEGYNYCDANANDPTQDPEYQKCNLYTLNRFNFNAAHQLLIPRAVGYGAGLVNHFFRGKLKISLPDEGLYSIVDHAQVNEIDQGFTTVKLKLKNITSDVNGVPQTMSDGKLVLVAKYGRNDCYEPDLTGEYTYWKYKFQYGLWRYVPFRSNGCENSQSASEEFISVSMEQYLPLDLAPQADPLTLTFDFSQQPIPINATHLFLQVVYQGKLGEDEAVIVANKDIAEPTYFSIINSTDYFAIDGTYYLVSDIYKDDALKERVKYRNIDPYPLTHIQIKGQSNNPTLILEKAVLEAASYFRIALLVDDSSFKLQYSHQTRWGNRNQSYHLPSRIDQKGSSASYLTRKRGIYHWTFVQSFGTFDGNLPEDRGIPAFDSLEPKPVTIHFGANNQP